MKLSLLHGAALGLFATAVLSSAARAQEAPPASTAPVTVETTTTQATGPSFAMVGSGIGILALSYLPVVVVGATSGLDADRNLFVPIAGPWIDLTQRPGCPASGSCNTETTPG